MVLKMNAKLNYYQKKKYIGLVCNEDGWKDFF